jgi:amidase
MNNFAAGLPPRFSVSRGPPLLLPISSLAYSVHISRLPAITKMSSIDLLDASIDQLSKALLAREITAVQLVKGYEKRISEVNDTLHAVLSLLPDVNAQAEACDKALAAGKSLGPLHGIPILIKDHINIEGQPSCMGSHALRSSRARRDATLIKQLRNAGAIILGFANLSQWGFSRSKTQVSTSYPFSAQHF